MILDGLGSPGAQRELQGERRQSRRDVLLKVYGRRAVPLDALDQLPQLGAVATIDGGKVVQGHAPALTAINERLRLDYAKDSDRGIQRFNKIIAAHEIDFALKLPHFAFNRGIGTFAGAHVTLDGDLIGDEEWQSRRDEWLPSEDDFRFVDSLL